MANSLTRFDPFSELARIDPFRGLDEIFNLGVSAITGSLGFSNSGELIENLGVTYSVDEIVAVTRGRIPSSDTRFFPNFLPSLSDQ